MRPQVQPLQPLQYNDKVKNISMKPKKIQIRGQNTSKDELLPLPSPP
jgi:hypothetical protein